MPRTATSPVEPVAAAISRPRLHDEVTARLRDLIVHNRIRPGERVPELEVAAQLGVSRTPVRQALDPWRVATQAWLAASLGG